MLGPPETESINQRSGKKNSSLKVFLLVDKLEDIGCVHDIILNGFGVLPLSFQSDKYNFNNLLVVALDGVHCEVADSVFTGCSSVPVKSVFPTTSTSAWTTSLTGMSPSEHGVVGTVFQDGSDRINCLHDERIDTPLPFWAEKTIFKKLAGVAESTAWLGGMASLSSHWVKALTNGAKRLSPRECWEKKSFEHDATGMMKHGIDELNMVLSAIRSSKPQLVWGHIDFDRYVHFHGYDDSALDALASLSKAIPKWNSMGWAVLLYSDHGLTETRENSACAELFKLINDRSYCASPCGGAGRALWAYPLAHKRKELWDNIKKSAATYADVLDRREAVMRGYFKRTEYVERRVGDYLIISRGNEFPLFNSNYRYEHGALTEEEVNVPVIFYPQN
jgi:hypothetical protein